MRRTLLVVGALAGAFACKPGAQPLRSAEEVLSPVVRIRFGMDIADVQADHPRLAPTGWTQGDRATWIDPSVQGGLEIETAGGVVRAVAVSLDGEDAEAMKERLGRGLGPGAECGALPEGAPSFRSRLWRLPDGGSVTYVEKLGRGELRVEKPASQAFLAAWTRCQG